MIPPHEPVVESHMNKNGDVTILVSYELLPQFAMMVRRALNTFADAHPAIKEFGDILDHGKVLQDYWSQRSDKQG